MGSEVRSLLLKPPSQISEKEKFLTHFQMSQLLVLSILGYEVKVEELGKRIRTSRRLQLCKSFSGAKVERRLTSTGIEC